MDALVVGLERSKARFIWVINSANSQQRVPDRFHDDRGVVIRGWAPQVEILNHKAVAGFVSHCGWNSMLESTMAGVMLLGWPMEADQFVNAKQLLEYKGLTVKLCEGADTVPDADEFARIINDSVGQDIPQKARVKALKEKALQALKDGGTSSTGLDELVKQLTQNGVSNT
ncbi:UDP-glycosyltransferase 89A2 [Bienertia sinuspersici]